MKKIMTPSDKTMTGPQIDKAVANYRAMLEKFAPQFDADAVQTVLGQSDFADAQLSIFRTRVEAVSEMIIRHVKVDRTKTPQQMIAALGRTPYVTDAILETMPRGEGEEVDVVFFPLKRYVPTTEWLAELELRGLKPDHYAQLQANVDDKAFADEHPNGSQWGLDEKGNASFVAVDRWRGGRRDVNVSRNDSDWSDHWWGCGVRK
jgi:hypothetical protein